MVSYFQIIFQKFDQEHECGGPCPSTNIQIIFHFIFLFDHFESLLLSLFLFSALQVENSPSIRACKAVASSLLQSYQTLVFSSSNTGFYIHVLKASLHMNKLVGLYTLTDTFDCNQTLFIQHLGKGFQPVKNGTRRYREYFSPRDLSPHRAPAGENLREHNRTEIRQE